METNVGNLTSALITFCFGGFVGVGIALYALLNKWEKPELFTPVCYVITGLFVFLFVFILVISPSVFADLLTLIAIFTTAAAVPVLIYYEWQSHTAEENKKSTEIALSKPEERGLTTDEKLAQILKNNKRQ